MIIIKYETEEEMNTIIAKQEELGHTLTNVANIKDGNFLGFDENRPIVNTPIEIKLEALDSKLTEVLTKVTGIETEIIKQ